MYAGEVPNRAAASVELTPSRVMRRSVSISSAVQFRLTFMPVFYPEKSDRANNIGFYR
jgi:hypothetical protein